MRLKELAIRFVRRGSDTRSTCIRSIQVNRRPGYENILPISPSHVLNQSVRWKSKVRLMVAE